MTLTGIQSANVLGVRFHRVTVAELRKYVLEAARTPPATTVANVNVNAMNLAYRLPWFHDFLNGSDLVFCDGFGVLLAARVMGYKVKSEHRMTAPDFFEDLAGDFAEAGQSIFLLAGRPGISEASIAKLKARHPRLKIEGRHGYFEKTGSENTAVIEEINSFQPDLLTVGFGMPLQERWIADNRQALNARVIMPLGAFLDHYTRTGSRGPKWMNANGLEWLARLAAEPRRLWKRYLLGNPLFFARVMRERLRH